jgi:hypothetical protein
MEEGSEARHLKVRMEALTEIRELRTEALTKI